MKITQYSAAPNHINEFKILNQLKMPSSLDDYNLTEKEKELIQKVVGTKEKEVTEETEEGGGKKPKNKTRKIKKSFFGLF